MSMIRRVQNIDTVDYVYRRKQRTLGNIIREKDDQIVNLQDQIKTHQENQREFQEQFKKMSEHVKYMQGGDGVLNAQKDYKSFPKDS